MTVSFSTDILPMFTSVDIEHMAGLGLSLDDYTSMSQPATANAVYQRVADGTMPPPESGAQPWSSEQVQLFKAWMDGGYQR